MVRPQVLARAVRSGPSRLFARAESTSAPSSSFKPALPAGQDQAYDLALEYIAEQTAKKQARAQEFQAKVGANPTPEQAQRIARMQVEAMLDDPATRREFSENGGKGQMDRPVMRHLARQAWTRAGELDLVMQRVYQLGIVPDLLPDVSQRGALRIEGIEAGTILPPSQLANPPKVSLQFFDQPPGVSPLAPVDTKALYTLLIVDADIPNHETASYEQRLLYAKSDIPLSILSGEVDLITGPGNEFVSYEPPVPCSGSGKHRCAFIVLAQKENGGTMSSERANFNLRAFLESAGLTAKDVAAASVIRSEWTKEDRKYVNETYERIHGVPAPVYGKAPRDLRYGYPLSAKAQRVADARAAAWDEAIAKMQAFEEGEPEQPQQA
ncbi:hypothetical protein A1Q2_05533 [Trichosporon asahii var. asahii CBS 8904]|uniref:PEBP-like protein n=1 Tax=Trichosporon asahii var. asahii (strain CBS 8904) TaxID=1220162 RepID=K1V8B6_TRIAC|nr:hypothetical protein A1Q2_05533 [Trichosporon asahii var. asahii CBS 8904]